MNCEKSVNVNARKFKVVENTPEVLEKAYSSNLPTKISPDVSKSPWILTQDNLAQSIGTGRNSSNSNNKGPIHAIKRCLRCWNRWRWFLSECLLRNWLLSSILQLSGITSYNLNLQRSSKNIELDYADSCANLSRHMSNSVARVAEEFNIFQ